MWDCCDQSKREINWCFNAGRMIAVGNSMAEKWICKVMPNSKCNWWYATVQVAAAKCMRCFNHLHPSQQRRHFNGFWKEFMFSLQQLEMMVLSAPFVLDDHFISFFCEFPLALHCIFSVFLCVSISIHNAFIGIASHINRGNVSWTLRYATNSNREKKEKKKKTA